MTKKYILGDEPLSLEVVDQVARGKRGISISETVKTKLSETRSLIEAQWMHDEAPLIYSFNTGVGVFKNTRVSMQDMAQFQQNIIYAHATGVGPDLAEDVVRAVMLLRLNAFMADYSGVSIAVAERMADFLNHGLVPGIPEQGSVGASGDLAPLAHMAGALCGFEEAVIYVDGKRLSAMDALTQAGLPVSMEMQSKDASALINGSTVSLAIAALALIDSRNLVKHADVSLALSLEAMRCEKDAFLPEIHEARPHPGQQLVARNVSRLTNGSKRMTEEARGVVYPSESPSQNETRPPRVQDAYSLRCAPQVHGPAREALDYAATIVERELNSATDNPLIVEVDGVRRAVSGGHFHGQYIAQVMDLLAIAMTDLASICERRVARLIDPIMSCGLARNLASGQPGLNTGYATVQCSLSSLVMENRTLSSPGSTDSIPGKGNAEDHVSNSTWCARKASKIVENAKAVIAGEILVACQALSSVEQIAADFPIGIGSEAALRSVRKVIPYQDSGDIWYAKDMNSATELVASGQLIAQCADANVPVE